MFAEDNAELIESFQMDEYARRLLKKEAREVMKLPPLERNEHYAKVKKERGTKAAVGLVSEVKKQRYLQSQREEMEM